MTEYETDIKLSDDTNLKYINIEGYKIFIYDIEYLERIKGLYGFIYITTNLINGKMYVGQKRVNKKDDHWKTYLGSGTAFKNALNKYGKENFDRKIIDIAFNYNELNFLEYFYTKKFDSVNSDQWYNIIYGGKSRKGLKGKPLTEEHKKLLSERMKGKNNPNYGRQYTKEEKEKLSKRMSGENNPMYGKSGKNSPNYGRKHTEKTKQKMRESSLGEKNPNYGRCASKESKEGYQKYLELYGNPNSKQVLQYDSNGDFIKKYNNAQIAHKTTGINHSTICACCRGEVKSAGGYQWRYHDKKNNDFPLKIEHYKRFDKKQNKPKKTRMNPEEVSKYLSNLKSIMVNQYTLNDIFIKTYSSAMEAHDLDGFDNSSIGKCCKGKINQYKGFKWYYADDPDQPDKSKIVH